MIYPETPPRGSNALQGLYDLAIQENDLVRAFNEHTPEEDKVTYVPDSVEEVMKHDTAIERFYVRKSALPAPGLVDWRITKAIQTTATEISGKYNVEEYYQIIPGLVKASIPFRSTSSKALPYGRAIPWDNSDLLGTAVHEFTAPSCVLLDHHAGTEISSHFKINEVPLGFFSLSVKVDKQFTLSGYWYEDAHAGSDLRTTGAMAISDLQIWPRYDLSEGADGKYDYVMRSNMWMKSGTSPITGYWRDNADKTVDIYELIYPPGPNIAISGATLGSRFLPPQKRITLKNWTFTIHFGLTEAESYGTTNATGDNALNGRMLPLGFVTPPGVSPYELNITGTPSYRREAEIRLFDFTVAEVQPAVSVINHN